MCKTITIDGQAVVSRDENNSVRFLQFLSCDGYVPILEKGCKINGQLLMMSNGSFEFVPSQPRIRDNSQLICKVAHGRLSGTKDKAIQLTLKAFDCEQIDWQQAFIQESIEALVCLMGPQRMREILNAELKKLEAQGQVEKSWRPFDVEW